jgi:CBS domain-containing protein
MLRLRDIMTTDLVTVDPNFTIREAMEVLASNRISGAPVVAGERVIGVVSATDLLQLAAGLPGVPTERELTPDLLDDDSDAHGFPSVLSTDEESSALYYTDLWDDAGATVVERMSGPANSEWNSLEEHTVAEAMTRLPVHALTPDTFVTVAADYMRRARIHRVLVMSGSKLLGVVTTSDITNAVADGKLTVHTYVFDRRSHTGARNSPYPHR